MSSSLILHDQKLWRRIDREVAQYSIMGSAGQLIVIALVAVPEWIGINFPMSTAILSLCMVAAITLRVFFFVRFDLLYARHPSRWRRQCISIHHLQSAVWSLTVFSMIYTFGLHTLSFVCLLYGIALTAIQVILWAAYPAVNRLHLLLTILPMIAALLLIHTPESFMVAAILALFLWAMLKQSALLHDRFWLQLNYAQTARASLRDLEAERQRAAEDFTIHSSFLANLSRELRIPMHTVVGMLDLLGYTELSTDQRRMQNTAISSAQSILQLLDEIVDMSRLLTDRLVFESAVFNIRRCIDEVMNVVAPVSVARSVELNAIFDADIPLRVQGDRKRIHQILAHYLLFLIHHVAHKEVTLRVNLQTLHASEGVLNLVLIAHDANLSSGELHRLQRMFASGKIDGNMASIQLGLAIAHGLVHGLHGQTAIESTPRGVELSCKIPLALSTQQALRSKTPRSFIQQRVLVVSTSQGLSESLANELKSWQMEWVIVSKTEDALALLNTALEAGSPFCVLIYDLNEDENNLCHFPIQVSENSEFNIGQIWLGTLHHRRDPQLIQLERRFNNVIFLTKPFTRGNLFFAFLALLEKHERSIELNDTLEIEGWNDETAPKILLIDSHTVNQQVTKQLLVQLGAIVCVASSGQFALKKLQEHFFDIILMECQLDNENGFELARQIRQWEEAQNAQILLTHQVHVFNERSNKPIFKRTPIISLTAAVGQETQCFAAGMDDYLMKPISSTKLASTLRAWLSSDPPPEDVFHFPQSMPNDEQRPG
ncbi:MAG: response regulator [Pseudomonadota bacterium]